MKVLVTGATGTVGGEVGQGASSARNGCAGFDTQAAQARYVSWRGRDCEDARVLVDCSGSLCVTVSLPPSKFKRLLLS
jgi:uncharacterized protein YbjT (DUF2867 family)